MFSLKKSKLHNFENVIFNNIEVGASETDQTDNLSYYRPFRIGQNLYLDPFPCDNYQYYNLNHFFRWSKIQILSSQRPKFIKTEHLPLKNSLTIQK